MRLLRAEVSTCAPHRPIGADRSFRIRRKVMTDTPAEPRFTWVDVEQWADHGLIRSDQVQAIRAHVARVSSPTPPAADSHTMDLTVRPVITERRAGLNLVTVRSDPTKYRQSALTSPECPARPRRLQTPTPWI